jgi:hypothetical protein
MPLFRLLSRSAVALALAAAVAVAGLLAAGCASSGPSPSSTADPSPWWIPTTAPPTPSTAPSTGSTTAPAFASGSAEAALASLEVKGRAPKTGYSRDAFGPSWADVDRNGCDTRNDILARDLVDVVYRDGGCVVASGLLYDPYTGSLISFTRGQSTSSAVQIDHVVALSDAWQKGAQGWDAGTRAAFANDPLNLLAVDGPANGQKGDGDAATWLPANRAFRCEYVARQVAVKAKYGLWVTAAERDAAAGVLADCPGEPLPAS